MPIDYAKIRKDKWAPEGGPPDWPNGVRPISMDGLTLIGIGPDNRRSQQNREGDSVHTVPRVNRGNVGGDVSPSSIMEECGEEFAGIGLRLGAWKRSCLAGPTN